MWLEPKGPWPNRAVSKPGTIGYVPDAFDELISKGEIPITIGLFVNPGIIPAPNYSSQLRLNRSYEYDSLGPCYANFLIEELIPSLNLNLSNQGRLQLVLPRPAYEDGRINYCCLHKDLFYTASTNAESSSKELQRGNLRSNRETTGPYRVRIDNSLMSSNGPRPSLPEHRIPKLWPLPEMYP